MDKLKVNLKLLLVCVVIGTIVSLTTGCFLYQNHKTGWNDRARKAFTEALKENLQKYEEADVFFLSWGNTKSIIENDSARNDSLQEVEVISEYGKKTYLVPTYKLDHNIEPNELKRGIQGYILEEELLLADSLHSKWVKLLQEMNFSGKSIVRVSVTDLFEHETKKYSNDSAYINRADSLVSYYIGYRSEIEVTGFLYLQWWQLFFVKEVMLLCGIVVVCFLFPFIEKHIRRLYHYYFFKTPVVPVETLPVIAAKKGDSYIYELDKGVLFNANTRMLIKGDSRVTMTPQIADLLKIFLDAEDYKLSVDEIQKKMWGAKHRNKEKVYITINRLRGYLSGISACKIINVTAAYQLEIPDFIEENPQ